jgi:hypothetical protein
VDASIKGIATKTGLSELAVDYLMEEAQTVVEYAMIPSGEINVKTHQTYLDLVNLLLENHSQLYAAAQIYEDYLDAMEKCEGFTDVVSAQEGFEQLLEQTKPENKNRYVLTAGERAEYCMYLLDQRLHSLVKGSLDRSDDNAET